MNVFRVRLGENRRAWIVMANRRVIDHFATKQEAIDVAERLADESGGEVMIYGKDGQIYRDPFPLNRAREKQMRDAIRKVSNLPSSKNGYHPVAGAYHAPSSYRPNGVQ